MSKVNKRSPDWYGWLPDIPDHRDCLYSAIAPKIRAMPRKVDLRAGCSPVDNQGSLGSCTANALAGALEFLEKKDGAAFVDLSRLFIYYNERAMEGTVHEDPGAFIRDGIKTLAKQGCCPEWDWPYVVDKVTFKKRPPKSCYEKARKHRITSYHRIKGLAEMRNCLADGYPFVFGFSVYKCFESKAIEKTGVLKMPGKNEKDTGGHAVMAVGYNDREKRFLIRNSWDTDWGMKGYFTMPYAYLENPDLADDFWAIRASEKG